MSRYLKFYPIVSLAAILCILAGYWVYCRYFTPLHVTGVYIVRHAEKASGGSDPVLTAAGQARAQELARVLGAVGLDAVFATPFQRTQLTAAPVAAAQGLTTQIYDANDAAGVVATILADHRGGEVLVVGHSNTVDDIAAALGVGGVSELSEGQFDRLFVVHRINRIGHLDELRYGVATP